MAADPTPAALKTAKTSADPGWAETSVRWLRTHHPKYVPTASKRPAPVLLAQALKMMFYLRHEMKTFSGSAWVNHLVNESEAWTARNHAEMIEFLKAGGYEPEVEAAREKAEAKAGSILVTDPATGVTEALTMDFDEVEEQIVKEHAPRSQLSPKHELEEIVAEAARASDPRFGVW